MVRIMDYQLLTTLAFILVNQCGRIGGKFLDPIYWNATNPIFSNNKGTTRDLTKDAFYNMYVQIGDKMDVICPFRGPNSKDDIFYLALYQVDKDGFDACRTNPKVDTRLMLCNIPDREKKYTFIFQEIAPSPWGLEFEDGKTYYYISTSDGTQKGIGEDKGGVCSENNMRIAVHVRKNRDKDVNEVYQPELENVSEKTQGPPVVPNPDVYPPKGGHNVNEDRPAFFQDPSDNSHGNTQWQSSQNEDSIQHNVVNSNGLVIGIVLGACAVLFIVLLSFLGYKVYRRRRHDKKYRSPSMTPSRGVSQGQVTLLPTPGHHQNAVTHLTRHANGTPVLHMEDYRPPPPYEEGVTMDHAGTTVEV